MAARHVLVENARHQETLHVRLVNIELFGDEGNLYARVRLDELDQHLSANVGQQICNTKQMR